MTELPTITVSKLAAARQQLETALFLFFIRPDDRISIHTLACASHQVLGDLAKKVDSPSQLDRTIELAPNGLKKEIRDHVRQSQNFFKHANKDGPNSEVEFVPAHTEVILLDSIAVFQRLTGKQPPLLCLAFRRWCLTHHLDWWVKEPLPGSIERSQERLRLLSRPEFLKSFLDHHVVSTAEDQRRT